MAAAVVAAGAATRRGFLASRHGRNLVRTFTARHQQPELLFSKAPTAAAAVRGRPLTATIRANVSPPVAAVARSSGSPRSTRRPLFSLAAAALRQASSPDPPPQHTITTVRTLPYAAADLFRIIADVDAYAQFLPHCATSRVTHWRQTEEASGGSSSTAPAPTLRRWPARADLTVGWGPLAQTYSSRVYCCPQHGVVEAVSGTRGTPTLTAAERAEIGLGGDGKENEEEQGSAQAGVQTADDDTFESLVTRWRVVPVDTTARPPAAGPSTRVELHIRFRFQNPLYQLAAAQAGGELAAKMITAFEARAAALLGSPKSGSAGTGAGAAAGRARH